MGALKSRYEPGLLRKVFDPFEDVKISAKARSNAADEIADYLKEQILSSVGEAKSPITGKEFPALDKDYSKKKSAEGGTPIANLEEHGDMLDALEVTTAAGGKIVIQIEGEEAEKADGHCKLTGRKNPFLKKKRRFIPGPDEEFSREIMDGVNEIIDRYVEEES